MSGGAATVGTGVVQSGSRAPVAATCVGAIVGASAWGVLVQVGIAEGVGVGEGIGLRVVVGVRVGSSAGGAVLVTVGGDVGLWVRAGGLEVEVAGKDGGATIVGSGVWEGVGVPVGLVVEWTVVGVSAEAIAGAGVPVQAPRLLAMRARSRSPATIVALSLPLVCFSS